MTRRCPPYVFKPEDIALLIEAGKTAAEAAQITGYDVAYMCHLASRWGMAFKKGIRGPKPKSRAYYYAETMRRSYIYRGNCSNGVKHVH